MNDGLTEYIEDIKKNPDDYCDKIRRLYLGIIDPIVQGKNPDFYYDPNPGNKFIRFCQGDIHDLEQFKGMLAAAQGTNNHEKMSSIQRAGVFCGFIRQHTAEWAGLPLILVPYQKALFLTKYGIKWRAGHGPEGMDDKQRFLESFIVVGRKNGKSTIEVGDALFSLFFEPGAEVYVAATKYAQARRIWDEATNVIASSPALSSMLDWRVFPQAEIKFKKLKKGIQNTSTFKVLSKETKTQDGLNISHAIIDECHMLPRETYTILKQGTSARNGQITQITTAGYLRGGLYDDQYSYSEAVLKGEGGSPSLLPIIYELDPTDAFMTNPLCWKKANPSLGVIKKVAYLQDQVERAKTDVNTLSDIKLKDFNIVTNSRSAWLSAEQLNQDTNYPDDESLREFDNSYVLGAFDLSRSGDCTAVTTLVYAARYKKIIAKNMYWVTNDFLESPDCKRSGVPWKIWIDRGLVRIAGDHLINSGVVSDYFMEEIERHGWVYQHIGYDPYSAVELIQKMEETGFISEKMVAKEDKDMACLKIVRQNSGVMTKPIELLGALLKAKKLDFMNNPVTKWMLSNATLIQDCHGMMMLDKKERNSAMKIDGAATILDALAILGENIDGYCEGLSQDLGMEENE